MTVMTGYLYNAEGIRVAKGTITAWSCDPAVNGFETTNDYILGLGGEQVTEMGVGGASSGTTTNGLVWQHTNVWAGGQLAATYSNADPYDEPAGDLYFHLSDWLGTRRVLTDSAGVVAEVCHSLPYGNGEDCVPPGATEHLYTGKERDAESGNDYFMARYYSSAMGRFLSPDPIIVTPARMAEPQRFNLYSYAVNNPLHFVDPTGEDVDFVNDTEEGRKKALADATKNMSAKEAANIGIRKNKDGAYEAYVIDKGAIGKGASTQYSQMVGLINDHSIVAEVGLVGGGLTATYSQGALAGFGPISSWSGGDAVFGPNPGSNHIDVLVTQGDYPGGTQVCCDGGGHPYQGVQPEYITMWHELMGETLKYRAGDYYLQNNPILDSKRVISIENETRSAHGLPPRTGSDHGQTVITVDGKAQ